MAALGAHVSAKLRCAVAWVRASIDFIIIDPEHTPQREAAMAASRSFVAI